MGDQRGSAYNEYMLIPGMLVTGVFCSCNNLVATSQCLLTMFLMMFLSANIPVPLGPRPRSIHDRLGLSTSSLQTEVYTRS